MKNFIRAGLFANVENPIAKVQQLTTILQRIEQSRTGVKIPDVSPKLIGELLIPVTKEGTIRLMKARVIPKGEGSQFDWAERWSQSHVSMLIPTSQNCRAATGFAHIVCIN